MSKNIAVIFAGGSGARMGTGIPKQFIKVDGTPIIQYTLENFEDHSEIDEIYISCKAGYLESLREIVRKGMLRKVAQVVVGGDTALESTYNALQAVRENCSPEDIVLIHDGVRPCITDEIISENITSVKVHGSAVTAAAMFETPIISNGENVIEGVVPRDRFFTAQAPQSFYLHDILEAHEQVRATNPAYEGIVDSCTLMQSLGRQVALVRGNRGNIKVTTPEDLYIFQGLLQYREAWQAFGVAEREIPHILKK
ncbi:MAG: 2-C-methyl-D-erythritol 4-phosphate cytidylyltransferase [Coriobacteriia bacterium]|nr:2-C-methyl-D-erythritol 4-phosphate cytidylyltransferase [Coriobacteriia bacterium]